MDYWSLCTLIIRVTLFVRHMFQMDKHGAILTFDQHAPQNIGTLRVHTAQPHARSLAQGARLLLNFVIAPRAARKPHQRRQLQLTRAGGNI